MGLLKDKVLVTGSSGFVGKNLCSKLVEQGAEMAGSLSSASERIDVTDYSELQDLGEVNAIVHLAAKTSITNSVNDPYGTYYMNLLGTLNLLEFAKARNVKKFIYVSSYVYGNPLYLPINESHPVNPHSPYNKSKLLAEQLCENYSKDSGLDVVTLRPFYLYGPSDKPDFLIPSIIRQINKDKKVTLSGKSTRRDFLFISDFVDLLTLILGKFPAGYNLYNVGSGESHTIAEVAEFIAKLMDVKVSMEYSLHRASDITEMVADISKVSSVFGWKPVTTLEQGLRMVVQDAKI